jgi:predicted Zn-dependent peptidase
MSKIVKNYGCGLRLVVEEMPNYKSVATGVLVCVGSGSEAVNEHGLSHFCEHMLFKGTTRRTGEEITRELSTMGADYNAWTGENATCYHTKGIADNVEQCVDILADMYFNLRFTAEDFDKEGSVIVQEIAMHEDNPRSVVFELANSTFFAGTKYEHSIAGTAKQVKGYKPADIYNYIKKHYIAPKTIISFAGDITLAKAEQLAEKYFVNNYEANNYEPARPISKEIVPAPKTVRKKKKTEQQNVTLLFPVCNKFNDERYVLGVLSSIFNGDMSSRLFINVRERAGLVYTITGGMELTDIGGYYYIYFSCTAKNTRKVIDTIKKEIAVLLADGVTAEELQKVKNIKKAGRLFESENTESVCGRNVGELCEYNKIKTTEEYLAMINKVTAGDILTAAKKYLDINKMITVVVGK